MPGIHAAAAELAQELGLLDAKPSLGANLNSNTSNPNANNNPIKVVYSAARGYHLSVPLALLNAVEFAATQAAAAAAAQAAAEDASAGAGGGGGRFASAAQLRASPSAAAAAAAASREAGAAFMEHQQQQQQTGRFRGRGRGRGGGRAGGSGRGAWTGASGGGGGGGGWSAASTPASPGLGGGSGGGWPFLSPSVASAFGAYRPPSRFLQQVRGGGGRVLCTTAEVAALNARQEEAYRDAALLTAAVVQDLVRRVQAHLGWLLGVCEAVGLLDLLLSFACHVSLAQHEYTRPVLTEDGPIVVKRARHPLMEQNLAATAASAAAAAAAASRAGSGRGSGRSGSGGGGAAAGGFDLLAGAGGSGGGASAGGFVANDVFLTELSNLLVVTGPNNSGKSTYLRQVRICMHVNACACMRIHARMHACPTAQALSVRPSLLAVREGCVKFRLLIVHLKWLQLYVFYVSFPSSRPLAWIRACM